MKKFISIIMSIVLIMTIATPSFAFEEARNNNDFSSKRYNSIFNNARAFLSEIHSESFLLNNNGIKMYNFKNELEALFYELSPKGYIVVSFKNGQVLEYSPDDLPTDFQDVLTEETIYYGAPLSFYQKVSEGNDYKNIITEEIIEIDNVNQCYSDDYLLDITNEGVSHNHTENTRFTLSAPINYVAATYASGFYCTSTGVANLLQYYHDYYSADVYIGTVNTVTDLRYSLYSNYYVYYGPYLSFDTVKNPHTYYGVTYAGLQSYLNRTDVTTYTVSTSLITVNKVINYVQSRPLLLTIFTRGIDSNAPLNETHTVLCYGYWQTNNNTRNNTNENEGQRALTTYYIVNNGWGSNGVYVKSTYVGTESVFKLLRLV